MGFQKAKLVKKAGKSGFYACVTIPLALKPFSKNRRQQYKALGKDIRTTREAYETCRLSEKETLIWREFDEADLANHPLAVAYLSLEDKLAKQSDTSSFWSINELFNHSKRFDLEDDVRQRKAEEIGLARSSFDDFEVGSASKKYSELDDFLRVFLEEFRKRSEERFSPKKEVNYFLMLQKNTLSQHYFSKIRKFAKLNVKKRKLKSVEILKYLRAGLEAYC